MSESRDELGARNLRLSALPRTQVLSLVAGFFYWLAARLEKRHKEAVIRYNAKVWPASHTGHGAVTTKREEAV